MRRRDFIAAVAGATACPMAAVAQQKPLPVVAFIHPGSGDALAHLEVAFRRGLSQTGYVERQNVAVEYYWLEGRLDRVPALLSDLVRRRVAVIASIDDQIAAVAKAATATIPIVFAANQDPVKLGLVASLARPGGNLTGINFLSQEVVTKQLGLLHQLLPGAVCVAVLINPAEVTNSETALRQVQDAAPALGLQIQVLKASTSGEIDEVIWFV